MTIYTGEVHNIQATFRDAAGALVDPDVVEAYVIRPDRTKLGYVYGDPALTRSSVGVYLIEVTFITPGDWIIWFGFRTGSELKKTEPFPVQVSKSPWT